MSEPIYEASLIPDRNVTNSAADCFDSLRSRRHTKRTLRSFAASFAPQMASTWVPVITEYLAELVWKGKKKVIHLSPQVGINRRNSLWHFKGNDAASLMKQKRFHALGVFVLFISDLKKQKTNHTWEARLVENLQVLCQMSVKQFDEEPPDTCGRVFDTFGSAHTHVRTHAPTHSCMHTPGPSACITVCRRFIFLHQFLCAATGSKLNLDKKISRDHKR